MWTLQRLVLSSRMIANFKVEGPGNMAKPFVDKINRSSHMHSTSFSLFLFQKEVEYTCYMDYNIYRLHNITCDRMILINIDRRIPDKKRMRRGMGKVQISRHLTHWTQKTLLIHYG